MCQKCRNKHGAVPAGVLDKTDGDGGCISGVPATVLILSVLPERFCSCLTELWVNILCSDWWPAPAHRDGRGMTLGLWNESGQRVLIIWNVIKVWSKATGSCPAAWLADSGPLRARCSDGEAALKITLEVPTVPRVPSVPVGPLHIPIWRTVSWLNL